LPRAQGGYSKRVEDGAMLAMVVRSPA